MEMDGCLELRIEKQAMGEGFCEGKDKRERDTHTHTHTDTVTQTQSHRHTHTQLAHGKNIPLG
jgi:hypothetical protein